jgi:uncharacterized protein (TIGR03086 family)
MDPIDRIERATAFASEKIQGVTPADMTNPTPCPDFDVRALLNHVAGNLAMLTSAAEGGKAEIQRGDQLGSDAVGTYAERRSALLRALHGEDVFDRNWEMPFGSMPGAMMANIAFMEHLTHGWDLAKATGQDTAISPDLVEECTEVVTGMGDMLRIPGVCGPAVSVAADASAQDKLIAFLGRAP